MPTSSTLIREAASSAYVSLLVRRVLMWRDTSTQSTRANMSAQWGSLACLHAGCSKIDFLSSITLIFFTQSPLKKGVTSVKRSSLAAFWLELSARESSPSNWRTAISLSLKPIVPSNLITAKKLAKFWRLVMEPALLSSITYHFMNRPCLGHWKFNNLAEAVCTLPSMWELRSTSKK